jgi:hypothetical protein
LYKNRKKLNIKNTLISTTTKQVIMTTKNRDNKRSLKIAQVEKALNEIIRIVDNEIFIFQLLDVMDCCSKLCLPSLSICSLLILFNKVFVSNLIDGNSLIKEIVRSNKQTVSFTEMKEILTRLSDQSIAESLLVIPKAYKRTQPIKIPKRISDMQY